MFFSYFFMSLHLCRETLSPVGFGWCLDWYERQLQNRFPWQVWWHDTSEAQLVPHSGWGGDCGLFVSGYGTYLQLWGHWQWVKHITLHKLTHLEKRAYDYRVVSCNCVHGNRRSNLLPPQQSLSSGPWVRHLTTQGFQWSCSICSEQFCVNVLKWMSIKQDVTAGPLSSLFMIKKGLKNKIIYTYMQIQI